MGWMRTMSTTSSSGINAAAAEPAAQAPAMTGSLAALSLCMLLPSLGISIANVALPTFVEAFGAPFQQVQWVVVAYLLANTALVVFAGRLGDLAGRRKMLLVGLAIFTAASALCGMAPSLPMLVAARAVQGVGAALLMALTIAMVGDTVPKKQTGKAMGLLGTTSAVGTALGPSLGGMLVASAGWPGVFFVKLPLGLLALFLVWRYLPPDRPELKLVRPGAEARASGLLAWLGSLRDPSLATGLAMTLIVATVMMSTLVVGPFYLAQALGLATAAVGVAMSAGPIVSALSGVPAGKLVDRFGARRMTLVGLAGMVGGCLALATVPMGWGVAGYVLPLVVLTSHYALFQAANNTAVMKDVGPDRRGVVSGMLNLARNLGLLAGASAMGAVFVLGSGTGELAAVAADAVSAGMRTTFFVAAGLLVLAGALHRGASMLPADNRPRSG